MFELSGEWYEGRLNEAWQPPTVSEAEAVFAAHGLSGDFWRLG